MSPKARVLVVLASVVVGCADDVSESALSDTEGSTSSEGSTVTMTGSMSESADTSTGTTTTTDATESSSESSSTTGTTGTEESSSSSTDATRGSSSSESSSSTDPTLTTEPTSDATTTDATTTDATTTDATTTDATTTDATTTDVGSSSDGVPECTDDLECDDLLPCTEDLCVNGSCESTAQDGVTAPDDLQQGGDCSVVVCVAGDPADAVDDDDPFVDGNDCTDDVCTAGVPSNPPIGAGNDCSGGVCDGAGTCVECLVAGDCTALPADDECQTRTCIANVCDQSFTAPGTVLGDAAQTDGDCQRVVCDGSGGSGPVDDDLDLPDDGLECTADTCLAGVPDNDPLDVGTTCTAGVCDGSGGCVGCVDADDCVGTDTFCQTITCSLATCGVDNTAAGTDLPAADQNVACQTLECDGNGGVHGEPLPMGTACNDALFCNGGDTCDAAGACTHVGSPCLAAQACNETTDACQPNVWINEFHYDNVGGDVNEFVEVAADSSIAVGTVTVTLYNGSNGTSYNTLALSTFTVGATVNGITFYSRVLPVNGLQNDNEGIALDVGGVVLEFIGYESGVLATNGVANGMMSVDVGVSEQPAPAIGASLGRVGNGRQGSDFTWAAIADDNPGDANAGQTITP